jgi:hypothetical protein
MVVGGQRRQFGPLPEHPTLSLDAGYDYRCVYEDLAGRQVIPLIAKRGERTPIQADGRWVVERVRREALVDRVEVEDLHQSAVAAVGLKLRAA